MRLFLGHRDGVYRVASFTGTFQGQVVGSSGESTRAFHDSQPRAVRRRRQPEESVMTAGLLYVLIGPKRMRGGVTVLLECQLNDQTSKLHRTVDLGGVLARMAEALRRRRVS